VLTLLNVVDCKKPLMSLSLWHPSRKKDTKFTYHSRANENCRVIRRSKGATSNLHAQCVVAKDALQLIKPYIFCGSVIYSDDIGERMLLACLAEQHQDPVHPNPDPNKTA
jgi:hypothetical protein